MTKSRTSKVHKTPKLSVINPNNLVAKTTPTKSNHSKVYDRDSIALPSIGNALNRKGSFINSYNSNSHFTTFGKRNSTSTISFSSSGSSIYKNSQTRVNSSQPMRLFKKCKARIDHTLKIYEQMNKQANVDAGSKNIDSSEELFLNTILSKLDTCRDHVLRIDVAMLVDRYRRIMSRTGISKLDENVQEDKVDGLLSEIEEWCLKASLDDGLDIEDVSDLSDAVFQEMTGVDKELMVEGDLQKLKEKMGKLQKLNSKLGGTHTGPEHVKQELILEKQKLEKEVAQKISENNKAKNNNMVIMHAADEIFHLIEKARTESGANDDQEYQNQIASVLKELVKRDEAAADQSKKLKTVQEESERVKQDFFQLMDDHKDLKSEFDKVNLKCEKLNGENINLKKKLSSNGKSKVIEGGGPKISEEYALQKIKNLEEKIKHFEEQNKILTQKNKLLSDTIQDKDGELNNYCEQVSHLKRTTNFNNNAMAENGGKKKEKEKPKKKEENDGKRKTKTKKDDKVKDDTSILQLKQEIATIQEKLSSATSREQLLCRSNDKLKAECKEMLEKFNAMNKTHDFKCRELENIQAELNILRKQGKREATSSNKQTPIKHEVKTSNFSSQTEIILKSLSIQIDIPLEKITLEGNYNITSLIKVLHHKAGLTDLSKVMKLFKKSNEREISNIQQQISGYIPGFLNEAIPDFDMNKLEANTVVVNQQDDDFKNKTIEDIKEFAMFLSSSLEGNGTILNDVLLDLKQNCTLSKPNENKMSLLEEQISEFIEGSGDLANYSKRTGNIGGSYRVKAKSNSPEGNVEDSLTVAGFIRKSTNLNTMMSNTIHNFKDIACDELRRMAVERDNLKRRLASKFNNNEGGGEEPIRQAVEDHNPEEVLDDIQSMLENRLAKRRASTLNFSSLINKRTNIVIRKPGRGRKNNKSDIGSIKSDPGHQRTTVTRRPSVMAIMKKMTIQNAGNNENQNNFAVRNSASTTQHGIEHAAARGLNGNALMTGQNRTSMFGVLPKTAPIIPNNLSKFEKEYHQTQLRMHRREKIAGSNIQGLSSKSALKSNRSFNNNFTVGFGKNAGTNYGMVIGRGPSNSNHFEGLLTNTTAARNRLNPVFGSNLPRHNRRY